MSKPKDEFLSLLVPPRPSYWEMVKESRIRNKCPIIPPYLWNCFSWSYKLSSVWLVWMLSPYISSSLKEKCSFLQFTLHCQMLICLQDCQLIDWSQCNQHHNMLTQLVPQIANFSIRPTVISGKQLEIRLDNAVWISATRVVTIVDSRRNSPSDNEGAVSDITSMCSFEKNMDRM